MPIARDNLGFAGASRYDALVQVSVELFEKHGYRGTSLKQIADRVGINKASLYYYVDSKVDLLQAVYDKLAGELHAGIQSISPTEPPCRRLAAIIGNHVEFHIRHGDFVRIVWSERYELPPEVHREVRRREIEYETFVNDTIVDGISQGCLVGYTADLLTPALLGLLTTVYRWRPASGAAEVSVADVTSLVERFVFGAAAGCPEHGSLVTTS